MSLETPRRLNILTYNVGLLRWQMLHQPLFSNPAYVKQRFPFIVKALSELNDDIDVLCLQECYEDKHAKEICATLKSKLPYVARAKSGGILKFHNGLIILSKWPLSDIAYHPYKKVSPLEYYLASKGNLICTATIPALCPTASTDTPSPSQQVVLVMMHTTAGGTTHPNDDTVDEDRQDEIRQAVEVCHEAEAKGQYSILLGTFNRVVFLMLYLFTVMILCCIYCIKFVCLLVFSCANVGVTGDLNCGPEASPGNYQSLLDQGFIDATTTDVATLKDSKVVMSPPAPSFCTWDPKNYLNTIGPHADCPGQRCDHVLLYSPVRARAGKKGEDSSVASPSGGDLAEEGWRTTEVKEMFTGEIVPLSKAKDAIHSSLSDHYGLYVALQWFHPDTLK